VTFNNVIFAKLYAGCNKYNNLFTNLVYLVVQRFVEERRRRRHTIIILASLIINQKKLTVRTSAATNQLRVHSWANDTFFESMIF
jgi:hypothetical protein